MTSSPTDATAAAEGERLVLMLPGFEGPLDLLLELARGQKVDLAQISILALVEQYLAVVEGARRVRLELAADWLVMAAWLAWLKSRLLLPAPESLEAEVAAETLAARLATLEAMRKAAAWLAGRPQLRQEVFPRGAPEDRVEREVVGIKADLSQLLGAYLAGLRRGSGRNAYRPAPPALWTVQEAITRITGMLGKGPDWSELMRFIPAMAFSETQRKGAMASTLIAGLELARGGAAKLRQETPFGPILIGRAADE